MNKKEGKPTNRKRLEYQSLFCWWNRKGEALEKGKKIIGVVLIILSVTALFTWEKWGKNKFLYHEILVLNTSVEKGEQISESMIEVKNVEKGDKNTLTMKDINNVIGREAKQYIQEGAPLYQPYFVQQEVAGENRGDHQVFALPSQLLISMPRTLSQGNEIWLYVNGKSILSAMVSHVDEMENQVEILLTKKQVETVGKAIERGDKFLVTYH
ncbi:hypothetical protein M2140_000225 [Clostridiales Family XIII bacterium PM5-7]